MDNSYKQVSCSFYDVLEASALRAAPVVLVIEGKEWECVIEDVFAKGSEEFLVARDAGSGVKKTVRLDFISTITDPASGTTSSSDHC